MWGVMGTLSERLADVVAFDSSSADRVFDVRRSSRSALRFTDTDPNIRESSMAPFAFGADHVRDGAILAASL
jgi:hypothetical protein